MNREKNNLLQIQLRYVSNQESDGGLISVPSLKMIGDILKIAKEVEKDA